MRIIIYSSFLLLYCFLNLAHAQERPTTEEELKYQQYLKPIGDSARKTYGLLQQKKAGSWKAYKLDSLQTVSELLFLQERKRQVAFLKEHPDNYAGLYHFHMDFLNNFRYSFDSLSTLYAYFTPAIKATPLGMAVSAALSKKKRLLVGNSMPQFSFTTNEGEVVNLASFRGKKHVLLCFWDSGCLPCIRSIPLLKEIHETYGAQNLQLIHVSIDIVEKKWAEALNRYPMPWLQTLDLPPYIVEVKVKNLYDIHFIPQYFLLDKTGTLIYHNTQLEDDEDYKQLKGVLKKVIL